MTSAEEAPRDAIPSAREKDAPAEGEEGWDSREGETEELRGGGDLSQKKDLLDILALAAAAEQVEEPSVAEKAASFFADPSEGRKGFVDTLLGAGGARPVSPRPPSAPEPRRPAQSTNGKRAEGSRVMGQRRGQRARSGRG